MDNNLFRKEALDRFTAPEQLDRLMTVTSLRSWLILLAAGIILVSTIVWGVTGSINTRVETNGVLVNNGGVVAIPSGVAGQVSDIRVKTGATIKKGDIIARLDQKELIDEINALIVKIDAGRKAGQDVSALAGQLVSLRKELDEKSYIVAKEDGRAVEVYVKNGEYLQAGSPVVLMARGGDSVKNLIAVMYVPVEEGRRLTAGMEANIYPSFASKEEYGYMIGRVVSISEYPVTGQNIYSLVGSEDIAKKFTASGAVLEVSIDLVPSADTVSGFKWSTSLGPPLKIENGTLCAGAIITGKMRPIEMIIPSVRKLLGNQ